MGVRTAGGRENERKRERGGGNKRKMEAVCPWLSMIMLSQPTRHSVMFYFKWSPLYPTNNALLLSFRPSSDAEILWISTEWARKSGAKRAKTWMRCVHILTELPFCMPLLVVGWALKKMGPGGSLDGSLIFWAKKRTRKKELLKNGVCGSIRGQNPVKLCAVGSNTFFLLPQERMADISVRHCYYYYVVVVLSICNSTGCSRHTDYLTYF